jgi:NAD(P)H-dependent nitrite reductase small subunit
MDKPFIKVARKSEIPEDTGKLVSVDGKPVALFKFEGRIYALDPACPHQGGPLDEGGLHGKQVMCPWHGWEFDVTNGHCCFNDGIKVETYPVKEDGEDVYVQA